MHFTVEALLVVMVLLLHSRVLSFRHATARARRRGASFAATASNDAPPLFRFGVCADVQYVVDSDDSYNFQRTKVRRYRQSLEIYRQAVDHWRSLEDVSFALILGDILDGKSKQMKNQDVCLDQVLSISRQGPAKNLYTLGNHDHYCFSRPELHARLYQQIPETSPSKLYYSFSPHPLWRFISLDAYDVSLIGASTEENRLQAAALLKANNPNDLETSGTWFDGLPRDKFRYVPYNGGIGDAQLAWFKATLKDAKSKDQRCVVFCHQPSLAPDKPQSVLWNSEEVRQQMEESGNVALWIAGHDHDGQFNYCKDSQTYHLVPPAPIECAVGETAFGTIEVFADKLQLSWTGREPSRPTMLPWAGTREMLLGDGKVK